MKKGIIPRDAHDQAFGGLLHLFLTVEDNDWTVAKLAEELGISPGVLYKYCYADSSFPASLLAKLVDVTGDDRFLTFFLSQVGRVCYKKPRVSTQYGQEVHENLLDVENECLQVAQASLKALADKRIDPNEEATLSKLIDQSHAALARYQACLRLAVEKAARQ